MKPVPAARRLFGGWQVLSLLGRLAYPRCIHSWGQCPLLIPLQHLMMAGPSFGLGETAASWEAGGYSLPVNGEGQGGAGRGAARLTHTSIVAVSQEAGEGFLHRAPRF